jgi:PRTRC genetic system ThiF family protein
MYILERAFFESKRQSLSPIRIAVVGVGGTGSEIVSMLVNLHQGLVAIGKPGLHVVAYDPDTVSAANVVRQRYAPSDVGHPKALVLINRINLAFSLGWEGISKRFTSADAKYSWDVVISAVDSRRSRADLHRYAFAKGFYRWKFWLDTGNDHTTGQIILGTPRNEPGPRTHILPCATELHPELCDVSKPDDDSPSCSAAEAISKQDLFVNKYVAVLAVDLLWRLFRDERLEAHARYFDLRASSLAAKAAPERPKQSKKRAAKSTQRTTAA